MNKRVLLFRVWCLETKQMNRNVDTIAWTLGGKIQGCKTILDLDEDYIMRNDYNGKENFKLMQCTGIVDNNERYIFEGDFCKVIISDKNVITRVIAEVQYDSLYAAFRLGYMTEPNHFQKMFFGPELTIEVIGNIYETDYNILKKTYNRDFQIDSIFDIKTSEPKNNKTLIYIQ